MLLMVTFTAAFVAALMYWWTGGNVQPLNSLSCGLRDVVFNLALITAGIGLWVLLVVHLGLLLPGEGLVLVF